MPNGSPLNPKHMKSRAQRNGDKAEEAKDAASGVVKNDSHIGIITFTYPFHFKVSPADCKDVSINLYLSGNTFSPAIFMQEL
jgi:hypothetical protein